MRLSLPALAAFRHRVIAEAIETREEQVSQILERIALRSHTDAQGRQVHVGVRTLWRWLSRYRRGGLVARFLDDYYLWTGLERTRPWREWRLLDYLYKEGFPVPRPVAAYVSRSGIGYRGDLITELIPDAHSLASALADSRIELLPWQAIGACIRRFHDAGIYHADLNAHNILLDNRNKIYLLDFDRGERRTPGVLWQEANLGRLLRSLRKFIAQSVIESTAWNEFLQGYQVSKDS